uniref:Endoglucanase n=2 Tax=Elaeis guineensis var. tenera TaxID=51953 RepID=A0A6I9RXH3_ELAGV|nr:endoglucanase 8-like [Elaeis guineensis]
MKSLHYRFPLVVVLLVSLVVGGCCAHDYGDALDKCLLFFEGQRSGKLPASQRMTWRKDSALQDGRYLGVDLVGGYYDTGDNVKFGFPMAFTTTVLAWSIIEFGKEIGEQLDHAKEALRWATDYLLKATSETNKIYIQVGDPYADHNCWERPEDMDTLRTVYAVDTNKHGSEVAAEMAAALAAASIVFKSSDPSYSNMLLERSYQVFDFADKYRGSYSDNSSLGVWVCPFYCDGNGYEDELVWGAAWIYKASNNTWYWNYVMENIGQLESQEFGWDNKEAGIRVLIYKDLIASNDSNSNDLIAKAEDFACAVLPESPWKNVNYSAGGLLVKPGGSNMQNVAALSFLLLVLARDLSSQNNFVRCDSAVAYPNRLVEVAKSQTDYMLGSNPLQMSYMVGYGQKFPQRIHHRGSSLPSIDQHPGRIGCQDGKPYFESEGANPNLLVGAIVGGPNITDAYADSRSEFVESEPTTYINAPMVGVFAYFKANG